MLRALIRIAAACGAASLAAPFVLSSRALDEKGITIRGTVHSRSEYIKLHYSTWERIASVTVEFPLPEAGGVTFFDVPLDTANYDALHVGQSLPLKYLRVEDTPNVPMAHTLRQMHALPMVKLAEIPVLSKIGVLIASGEFRLGCAAAAVPIALFLLWHFTRSVVFGVAALIGVAALVGLTAISTFPRPTPAPRMNVQQGTGKVKSLDEIRHLFQGDHERGVEADQTVEVVGIEFVPIGRTQSVVAVDLIDRGSVPGLKENATVSIDYELNSPRTTYLRGASRKFEATNARGTLIGLFLYAVTAVVLLVAGQLIGLGYRRLTQRAN